MTIKHALITGIAFLLISTNAATEPLQWSAQDGGNDHWYEVVTVQGSTDWNTARDSAAAMLIDGHAGHLATITSDEENAWILQHLQMGDVWIGAVQPPGSPEPNGGWEWITGEAWSFENWCSNEPSNSGGNENRVTITHSWPRCPGAWNDADGSNSCSGFLVEWSVDPAPEVDAIQWPAAEGGNDHWYQVVTVAESIDWNEARAAAETTLLDGQPGYLATLTSVEESEWILGNLQMGDVWIGATQPQGSSEPLGGWEWITGEPWSYTNWCSGEPSNSGDEDRITIIHSWPRCPGSWNDANQHNFCSGYVIEWGETMTPIETTSWSDLKARFRLD